jgi:hypothetical protein
MLVVDLLMSIQYISEGTKYFWIGIVFMVNLKCKHIPRFVNDRAACRLLFVQKLNFIEVNFQV